MSRVRDYLNLIEDPSSARLEPGDPADGALLALLAYVAFSDGEVADQELEFLQKVLPHRDPEALRAWAAEAGQMELDLAIVADAMPTISERLTCLRFCARMAWKDGVIDEREHNLLVQLAEVFEFPAGTLQRILDEFRGRINGAPSLEDLKEAFDGTGWGAVQHGSGQMRSELNDLVPEGSTVVGRVGLDNVEVIGVLDTGVVGRFREGKAFLPWDEIVGFTRVPTLEAALVLRTEAGGRWTLVDHRLNGLAAVFTRLFEPPPERTGITPIILQSRGREDLP